MWMLFMDRHFSELATLCKWDLRRLDVDKRIELKVPVDNSSFLRSIMLPDPSVDGFLVSPCVILACAESERIAEYMAWFYGVRAGIVDVSGEPVRDVSVRADDVARILATDEERYVAWKRTVDVLRDFLREARGAYLDDMVREAENLGLYGWET